MATFAELNAAKPNDGVDKIWRTFGEDWHYQEALKHTKGLRAVYVLIRMSDKRGLAYAQERCQLVKTQRVFESLGVPCAIRHRQQSDGHWTKDGVYHPRPA